MRRPWVIAHRGASAEAPENTLAAFSRALELGADWVELDVRPTADRRLVAIHDATLRRTTGARGRVGRLRLEALQRLDAGSWFDGRFRGERIPTLEDVFDLLEPAAAGLLIELKRDRHDPPGLVELAVEAVRRSGLASRVILQSFDHALVSRIGELAPVIRTAALVDRRAADPAAAALAAGSQILALKWRLLRSGLVADARRRGVQVFVWTVDAPRDLERAVRLEVDGIITNQPGRLSRILAR